MFMRGSRKFYQRGSKFDNVFFLFVFLLMGGGRIKIPLLDILGFVRCSTP